MSSMDRGWEWAGLQKGHVSRGHGSFILTQIEKSLYLADLFP